MSPVWDQQGGAQWNQVGNLSMGGRLWVVRSPFYFQKIEGWLDPHIQPLLPVWAWTTPSMPAYNTCPPTYSQPNQMDGTMLDNMGFPHRKAMWVLSTQHPQLTKPICEHGPTPYWSVAAPASQGFVQSYWWAAWKASQGPLFANEKAWRL